MNVMRSGIIIYIGFFYIIYVSSYTIRLEHVKMKYYDPKYIKNATTNTFRSKRGDTYKTNVTSTTLHPWGNNITLVIYYKNTDGYVEHEIIRCRICDVFSIKWFSEIIKKYSNIPQTCPVPAGTYRITNLVLLAKNIPIQLPEGQKILGMKYVFTYNNKVMFHIQGVMIVE